MEQLDTLSGQIGFAADGRQYLTFTLGAEAYGVSILDVQEIKGYAAVTPIPNTPAYIKGVMNLRGAIIPVVDLRAKLAMVTDVSSSVGVVIVARLGGKVIGMVVDTVSDVLNIPLNEIRSTPDFGGEVDARFISGMAWAGDRLLVLLDLGRVFETEELGAVATNA